MKHKLLKTMMAIGLLSVASCGKEEPFYVILSPTGAPAFGLVQLSDDFTIETGAPATVGPKMTTDDYGAIIFDFYNGLNLIKNSDGRSHFRLWRIVTAGNLYIIGLGEDKTEITEGSKVLSFQENLLPDLVFKKTYADILSTLQITYVTQNEQLGPAIKNGTYGGESIDFVIAPEPIATKGLALRRAEGLSYSGPYSLNSKWEAPIPQAGLFVNEYYYQKYTSFFHRFYQNFDANIKSLSTPIEEGGSTYDTTALVNYLDNHWSKEEQIARWGNDSTTIASVQNHNGLAFLNDPSTLNLSDFYTRLGKASEYSQVSSYIVDPSILINESV